MGSIPPATPAVVSRRGAPRPTRAKVVHARSLQRPSGANGAEWRIWRCGQRAEPLPADNPASDGIEIDLTGPSFASSRRSYPTTPAGAPNGARRGRAGGGGVCSGAAPARPSQVASRPITRSTPTPARHPIRRGAADAPSPPPPRSAALPCCGSRRARSLRRGRVPLQRPTARARARPSEAAARRAACAAAAPFDDSPEADGKPPPVSLPGASRVLPVHLPSTSRPGKRGREAGGD